jgi:putative tricarboxylic transport membrane protein
VSSTLDGLLLGFEGALTPELLLAAFIGALVGTLVGLLPGLGSVAGAALVLPLVYSMEPAAALVVIAAVYAGTMYGGSTTSVLMNMPGEASAVVATFDGYPMTRKGRAGAALSVMAVGSFIAGTIALVLVTLLAPLLARSALAFGPAEYFALTLGGLLVLARLGGGSPMSGLLPMIIGLALSTVGQEAITGNFRFTFDVTELSVGIGIVPIAVGVFGIAELMTALEDRTPGGRRPVAPRLRELFPNREEWRRSWAPWGRGSILGFLFGLLPGPSGVLSTFAAYRVEKAVSKHRDELGTGAVEGIAAPEAANNAASMGSLIPVLSLGIPFSATLAVMISAMITMGVQPGPLLAEQRPDIFWGVIVSLYVANVMLLVLNLPLVGVWVSILRIPQKYLIPGIVVIAVIGGYSVRGSMVDVYVLLAAGIVGYVLRKLDFSMASLIIGLVLGPLIEKHLREGLFLSRGELSYFVSTPISITVWSLVLLALVGGAVAARRDRLRRRRLAAEQATGESRSGSEPPVAIDDRR